MVAIPAAIPVRLKQRFVIALVTLTAGLAALGESASADALQRLKLERLGAVHDAIAALTPQRQEIHRDGPFQDYRAVIHLHSYLSHDSRGTVEEIVSAAKKTGTRVLMFTDHTSKTYDPAVNGHHGLRDGVLMIPGIETEGYLVFPKESLKGVQGGSPQQFADQALAKGSLLFLSHLEERMDWQIKGLTGTEIYNTHADFKDEKKLAKALQNPLGIFQMMDLFQKYPQEAFGALMDYPTGYVKKWDEMCQTAPCTGVAANDSHQNVGLFARLLDGGKVRLEDALGEKLFDANLALLPMLAPMAQGKKPGEFLFQFRMDPYPISMRFTGTHLLMAELTEKSVRETLESGRAYVSFDWLADATGFDFAAISNSGRHEMGSQLDYQDGLKLHAQAPLPVQWRLFRNGNKVSESDGRSLELPVKQAGIYRVEAWLDIAGEKQVWIFSNPVYIRDQKTK